MAALLKVSYISFFTPTVALQVPNRAYHSAISYFTSLKITFVPLLNDACHRYRGGSWLQSDGAMLGIAALERWSRQC
jgi:hypothetical protein